MSKEVGWEDYEKGCAQFFRSRGFTTIPTPKSGDQGADVIATKDGKKYVIQCKCYSEKNVGNDAVQQVIAAREFYKCDVAIVMTNSRFTPKAKELAKNTNVILVPNFKIVKKNGSMRTRATVTSTRKLKNRRVRNRTIIGIIIAIIVLIIILVIFIRYPVLERSTTFRGVVSTKNNEYILPDSASRYYAESELSGLSKDELRLARNEIYARHGRKFDSEDLQEYFGNQSWYRGTIEPEDFKDSMLNEYEKANVDTIMAVEESK